MVQKSFLTYWMSLRSSCLARGIGDVHSGHGRGGSGKHRGCREKHQSLALKLTTRAPAGIRHLSLHSFCQASLPGGGGCRQERSWDPAQVALSVRLRPAQGLRLRGALRIARGLMGLVLNWSQAVDFSQGAKCIIKWQKGSTLHVKDNGGNLLDGL